VLPDAERWQQPSTRTFNRLLTDVHQAANMLRHLGVGRQDPVAVISPNCEELITATLAAQPALPHQSTAPCPENTSATSLSGPAQGF
jgi:fatty-acyl-CoA synthase